MKAIFTLFAFFISLSVLSQSVEMTTCPLQQSTQKWIAIFEAETSFENQLFLIKEKIYDDASFFEDLAAMQTHVNEVRNPEKLHSKECCCPLRIGLVYGNNEGVVLDLFKKPEIEELLEILTPEIISRIELNKFEANDLQSYAVEPCSGVTLFSEDKELKKQIKKLLRSVR